MSATPSASVSTASCFYTTQAPGGGSWSAEAANVEGLGGDGGAAAGAGGAHHDPAAAAGVGGQGRGRLAAVAGAPGGQAGQDGGQVAALVGEVVDAGLGGPLEHTLVPQ